MKTKQIIVSILRKFGLIDPADYARFLMLAYRNARKNNQFMKKNKGEKRIPPEIMMYEIFGDVNYFHYFRSGKKASDSIMKFIEQFIGRSKVNVLEWGCGTGRITANLAEHRSEEFRIYATDINSSMIDWCNNNIVGVEFVRNELTPPLNFKDGSMDVVYSTSVFTHLTRDMQKLWLSEIMRVLAKGGIFIFTVHGDYYAKSKLTDDEKRLYDSVGYVERTIAKEGSRTLATFQSAKYMRNEFLAQTEILAHYDDHDYELAGSQDIWIVRK